jgi:microcompartment protein CcmL/EutN
MRYYGEEAVGLIETVGMTPAIEGADKMLKAAEVELISYENIGSTLVTIVVKGDVAAVRASVKAGAAAAAAIGKLTAQNVMPRPIQAVGDVVSVHDIDGQTDGAERRGPYGALGSIETFGLVFALEAADSMGKAAEVELIGYENTASGYISILVGGDTAACETAVRAGVKAVEKMGAAVYSSVVIPRPHPDLRKITEQYRLDALLPAFASAAPDAPAEQGAAAPAVRETAVPTAKEPAAPVAMEPAAPASGAADRGNAAAKDKDKDKGKEGGESKK